ncbi:TOPRIM domain-containing protein [Caballeronia choica]|uniref:TOPRIM domain-containing protein n=1 Tax=Caballeronia choica TaxID=326476 RepID=A0A158KFD7_9BURK|nr:AAA family ATPase [Caballeronia choica]SAL79725.1 TOPRIM domain-containing protein [Caballeronia choica]
MASIKQLCALDVGRGLFPCFAVENGVCNCAKPGDCLSPGKHPVGSWTKNATKDTKRVGGWLTTKAIRNLGFATGNGLLVVDVDVHADRHTGQPAKGFETLTALVARHGKLRPFRITSTGTGGLHLWFRLPAGVVMRDSIGAQTGHPGIDTRGDGGYVVVAGSYTVGLYTDATADHRFPDLIEIDAPDAGFAPQWVIEAFGDARVYGANSRQSMFNNSASDAGIDATSTGSGESDLSAGLHHDWRYTQENAALLRHILTLAEMPDSFEPEYNDPDDRNRITKLGWNGGLTALERHGKRHGWPNAVILEMAKAYSARAPQYAADIAAGHVERQLHAINPTGKFKDGPLDVAALISSARRATGMSFFEMRDDAGSDARTETNSTRNASDRSGSKAQPKTEPSGNTNKTKDASEDTVLLARGDTVAVEAVSWLWHGHLARGAVTVLAGYAGTGKTTAALALAATMTKVVGEWPDGTKHAGAKSVLIWSGEDSAEHTLVPRLRAAGANLAKIHIIQGVIEKNKPHPFDPARDMDRLRTSIRKISDVAMLIMDPIVSAVKGDAHRANEVRRDMQPVIDLAAQHELAVIGVSHFAKGSEGAMPLHRLLGSQAFGALARMVLVVGRNEKTGERVIARAKSNLGPDGDGVMFSLRQTDIENGISAQQVRWGRVVTGSARTILAQVEGDSAVDAGAAFLYSELANGPVKVTDLKKAAKEAGIAWRTVERAKAETGTIAEKCGKKFWVWRLSTS